VLIHVEIVVLKKAGHSTKDVASRVGVDPKTVYNVMKRYSETGSIDSKPIPGRKRSVRTKRLVDVVRKRVSRNPRRSMRQMARSLDISETTMRRVVHEDLKCKALKLQRRHLISAASKAKRLDRCKKMADEIQGAGDKVFIWSDEKIFTVEAVANIQNDRFLATSSDAVPEGARKLFRRMKPAGVMVWAAVSSDGGKSPLVFVEEGTKVNSVVYLKMLEDNVLPWVTEAFGDNYAFTQDGAPAHTSNVTQQWCRSHFSGFWDKNVWPHPAQTSILWTSLFGLS
jgi:inhibitor of nuclear factor kappa-B kinase subunit alpha